MAWQQGGRERACSLWFRDTGCAQVAISLKTEDLRSISSSLIFFLKNFWREQSRLRCQPFLSPSSRREADRELITFFLIALLLSQLSFPKWLIFQPQQCQCWLEGGNETAAALAYSYTKILWCCMCHCCVCEDCAYFRRPTTEVRSSSRRKSNCLTRTGEPSTLRAAPKRKSEAIVALTTMWREAGSHFQLKSGRNCSVSPFIHTHSLSLSPSLSQESKCHIFCIS